MRIRLLKSIGASVVAVSALVFLKPTEMTAQNQVPAAALKAPLGEPDLQGIWTVEYDTPLQRSPRFANQEFFTEAQRTEFDRARSQVRGRDERPDRGSEADVAGAYNDAFGAMKRTGNRTSAIVDPPNGRIPSLTPEAAKIAAADRDFRLALMQATQTCKLNLPDVPAASTTQRPRRGVQIFRLATIQRA
jgi:hypothetical protein